MSEHSSEHTKLSPSEIHENPPATLDEQKMLSQALRGDWDSFVEDYEQKPQLRKAALNQSQQTALHIAVAAGESEIAIKLIFITAGKKGDIEMGPPPGRNSCDGDELDQKDERGDTALHLAAAMGMRNVCRHIVNVSPQLIFDCNIKGETPIFLAASHGWALPFFSFHLKAKGIRADDADQNRDFSFLIEDQNREYCKRDDGNTMLHCAIANDKLDLALLVLKLYPNLTTSSNNNGETPLHILATKPTAFRSGTPPLGIFEILVYSWITVENTLFNEDYAEKLKGPGETDMEDKKGPGETDMEEDKKGPGESDMEKDKKDMELMEKFAKPLLGEDMSGEGKGVLSSLALAKIANLVDDRYYGKRLKIMKPKHMWSKKILVELVKSWSDFKEECLGVIPFDGERTVPWATPILPISDSSVSNKMVEESTKTSKNKDSSVSDKMAELSTNTPNNKEISDTKIKKEFGETLFLIAVRMGIEEMVKAILKEFPDAISHKRVSDGKNALLLAVENRQIKVYDFLIKFMDEKKIPRKDVCKFQDRKRNNPLHLAAIRSHYQPWLADGEAMTMIWEYQWYKHVRDSFPLNFIEARNADGKTPLELFTYTHKDQMKTVQDARQWVNKTSQSCSVVASLIATVAYQSATTIPGDTNDKGRPKLDWKSNINAFMICAMIAMFTSFSSLVLFLSVFITPYLAIDAYGFYQGLLRKLVCGLFLLYFSIYFILSSFLAGQTAIQREWKASLLGRIALFILFMVFVPWTIFTFMQNILFPTFTLFNGRRPRPWYR